MREILYRGFHPCYNGTETISVNGKKIEGEWVFGYPFQRQILAEPPKIMIATGNISTGYDGALYNCEYVFPQTVGQYTGLTDKNGKKIFEGCILKFSYNESDKNPEFYSVEWKDDRGCYGYAETADKMIEIDCLHCEVVGNIHDNPELLGRDNNAEQR